VNWLAVRDYHVLEWKHEKLAQRRQGSLFMPRRRPDAQFTSRRSQRIGKDYRTLLR
jgi:hypothetical protein